MKRNPKVGDLVMLGTSTKPMLVVEGEQRIENHNGQALMAYVFELISEDKTGVVDVRTKKYVISDNTLLLPNHTSIDRDDIYLAGNVKLVKKVVTSVTYNRKK